jgi:acylphosphatase
MKNFLIIILCLFAVNTIANAQCSKKIVWTGSKAEFLDVNGAVENTLNEKVEVVSSKTDVKLSHSDKDDDALTGKIKDFSCNWSEAFKNGKTIIKSDLTEGMNPANSGVITIEAKDGKITILVEMDNHEGKTIKLYIDSYKEVE